jgi:hypothetical protein
MLKKTMILALAAMAVAAFSASVASANWTHNHKVIQSGTNPTDPVFTGQALFTSAVVGGIDCQTKATGQITGGTTTGHIGTFGPDLDETGSTVTTKCVTSGPIAPCLVKSVQSLGLPWTIHVVNSATISITTGEIVNVLENQTGGACGVVQQIKLKAGTVHGTITPGETCTVHQAHLSGELQTQTGSKVVVGGTQTLLPTKTYGTITSTAAADNGGVACT